MHEMGIAMQIIEIATASIPAEMKEAQVKQVNLKVGKLSAVVPSSLAFCFKIATADTQLADAVLHIEEVPVRAECRDCREEWIIDQPVFSCAACGSGSIEIISGRELDIESVEIQE